MVCKEGLKGYIYVEAFKQTHVKQAIEGVGALRMGLYTQQVGSMYRGHHWMHGCANDCVKATGESRKSTRPNLTLFLQLTLKNNCHDKDLVAHLVQKFSAAWLRRITKCFWSVFDLAHEF